MTRKQYVDLMKRYSEYYRDLEELYSVLSMFGTDCDIAGRLQDMFVQAIEIAAGDSEHWTSYFAFDYGCDLTKNRVKINENYVDTSDWGKVYDLICGEKDNGRMEG